MALTAADIALHTGPPRQGWNQCGPP